MASHCCSRMIWFNGSAAWVVVVAANKRRQRLSVAWRRGEDDCKLNMMFLTAVLL